MILEEDSLFQFNYDIPTDILSVRFPDAVGTPLSQVENSLQKLARNVSAFDVKKLLLDISSGVPGLDDAHYQELAKHFLQTLRQSRVEKVARVIPENPAREYLIDHFAQEIYKDLSLPFKAQSFHDKAEALAWLQDLNE